MSEISEYLADVVYPRIDAYEAGLLDQLSPRPGGRAYKLACPECGKRRAYYYPGGSAVVCNRRNSCAQTTTLWDVVQQARDLNNRDVLGVLCSAAGVEAPRRRQTHQARVQVSATRAFHEVTRKALHAHGHALRYLLNDRGLSYDDIERVGYGYYPDWQTVLSALSQAGVNEQTAIDLSLVPPPDRRDRRWLFDDRIVSTWTMEDGRIVPWGRAIPGGKGAGPKYIFAPGLVKDRPYGWRTSNRRVWAVEGTMDRDAMALLGIDNAVALGQSSPSSGQRDFFWRQDLLEFGHVVDGDAAGREGGLKSVRACEPLGITTYIVVIPPGYDDPDAMRRRGQGDYFRHLISYPATGGAFLAQYLIDAFLSRPGERGRIARDAAEAVHWLTPASAFDFRRLFAGAGMDLDTLSQDAVSLYARLREQGFDEESVQRRVATVTGYYVATELKPAR